MLESWGPWGPWGPWGTWAPWGPCRASLHLPVFQIRKFFITICLIYCFQIPELRAALLARRASGIASVCDVGICGWMCLERENFLSELEGWLMVYREFKDRMITIHQSRPRYTCNQSCMAWPGSSTQFNSMHCNARAAQLWFIQDTTRRATALPVSPCAWCSHAH